MRAALLDEVCDDLMRVDELRDGAHARLGREAEILGETPARGAERPRWFSGPHGFCACQCYEGMVAMMASTSASRPIVEARTRRSGYHRHPATSTACRRP